jgi:hypothetical protein
MDPPEGKIERATRNESRSRSYTHSQITLAQFSAATKTWLTRNGGREVVAISPPNRKQQAKPLMYKSSDTAAL